MSWQTVPFPSNPFCQRPPAAPPINVLWSREKKGNWLGRWGALRTKPTGVRGTLCHDIFCPVPFPASPSDLHRLGQPGHRFLVGYPREKIYVPWVPRIAHKSLTPGHLPGGVPLPDHWQRNRFQIDSERAQFSFLYCHLDGQNCQSPIASVQRTRSTLASHSAGPRGTNVKRMNANRAIRIAAQRTQGLWGLISVFLREIWPPTNASD